MKKFFKIIILLLIIVLLIPNGYFILPDIKQDYPENQEINKSLMTYIINLEESSDRLMHMQKMLKSFKFPKTRINAVKEASLSSAELSEKVNFKLYKKYMRSSPNLGTIGCSLSHIKTYKEFLNSEYEFALILEDDIIFDIKIIEKIIDDLLSHKHLWDITTLQKLHRGTPVTIFSLPTQPYELVLYLSNVTQSGAYIINRKAARKLLSTALPIIIPIDHYFTRIWELDLVFAGIHPIPITQGAAKSVINTTSIYKEQIKDEKDNPILKKIVRAHYQAQREIIRFMYNLYLYIKIKIF